MGGRPLPTPSLWNCAGCFSLHLYKFRKGGANPHRLSRYYYECRQLFKEASPDLARAAIELALDPQTDERVRSVPIVAGLDRAGVKPTDHDPAEDQVQPTWDPMQLSAEERGQLRAILEKMVGTGKP
jgi:hypothetical protein